MVIARTDKGNVMSDNQDSFLITEGEYPVYAVADGMGGHRGGRVASAMAVEGTRRALSGMAPDEDRLRRCFARVNREIYDRQYEDGNLSGMGTTLTVLWEDRARFLLGHVGDSRCYLLREGVLYQISSDHSLVAQLVREGALSQSDAESYPYRNIITRAVGTDFGLVPDISSHEKRPGDRWLLCSDGLTEYVKAAEMLAVLKDAPAEKAADALMRRALEGGGRDNITLILLEVGA